MIHTQPENSVTRSLRAAFPDGTVLAAVSGGPDSMAMFHALCELGSVRVIAAHFDHRLRAESHRDVEPVERVAARFGVRVVRGEGDVAAHARASRQSIEAAARELRYAFLERAADDAGADVIATAHTQSDHIETVMMRILRGADTRGLRGIPARRGRIVRPLLAVSRAETIAYCGAHAVPHVEDPSNTDRRHFRNHIRHDVLPSLRRVFPGLDAALLRLSDAANERFDEAENATRARLDAWAGAAGTGEWTLPLETLEGLDEEHRLHLISRALDRMGARDVTRAHYRAMSSGASVDLPGLRVRREHDGLVFTRRRASECTPEARVLGVPGAADIGEWTLTARRIEGAQAREAIAREETGAAYIAADGPLTVRFFREGDRMRPFGMNGHKKLSDIFIDEKIPRRMRARTPIVESRGEILWVAGVAVSESARVHGHTPEVTRVTATREEKV